MPMVNIQISYLERSTNRLTGSIVFLALMISGAILFDSNRMIAQMMFGGASLALIYTLFIARGHRPWK